MGSGVFQFSSSLAVLALYGCIGAGPDDELPGGDGPTQEVQQDIINGQVVSVSANDHGVAMVLVGNSLCTGTMLNHLWVLTAKHCVDGAPQTGATVNLNGITRTSEAIVVHPSQDVAVIMLSAAMPINGATSGFATPIYPGTNASLQNQILDCWGFGLNTFTSGAGVLRHAPLEVAFTTPAILDFVPNSNGQIQWHGDSGGTCFTTAGELRVTGVLSLGFSSGSEVIRARLVGPEAYRDWLLTLPFNESPPVVADFDGDHRSDLVFPFNGDPGLILYSAKLAPNAPSPRALERLPDGAPIWNEGPPLVGDFNNDGRDDLAFAFLASDGLQIRTKLSNGDGTYNPFTQQFSEGAEIWNKGQPLVGDVNEDGCDDIIFAWYAGDGEGLRIETKLSRCDGTGTYTSVSQEFPDGDGIWNRGQPLVGDFNGDGRADLAFAWRAPDGLQIRTKLSRGDGKYNPATQQLADGAALWNQGPPLVGDFDGDGRADFAFAWFTAEGGGLQIRTKLSSANGTYRTATQQFFDGTFIWNKGQPMVSDVDGDGLDDLVFAWYEGDGETRGLNISTKLSNGDGMFTPGNQQLGDGDFIWNRGGPKLTDTNGDGRADLVFPCERIGRILIRVKRSVAGGFVASEATL